MKIINVGILAHVDAGKTTVTEGLLYESGVIDKLGRVDDGTTVTDSMDLEKNRGITIKSSTISFNYKGVKVNIIDTPGHMDFIAEVERSLRILDGAVLVISAKEGVQLQTKIIFDTLLRLRIPTIIFVNKIDRDGVNIEKLYKDLSSKLSPNFILMEKLKINEGSFEIVSIDEDINFREKFYSSLLDLNDQLGKKYLNEEEITSKDYDMAFLDGVKASRLFPLFHGSGLKNIGIDKLLDGIITCFTNGTNEARDKLSAYVYKIDRSIKSDKLTYLKVFGGTINARDVIRINGSDRTLKIKSLRCLSNGKLITTDSVAWGDIAVVVNDKQLKIGDFIGDKPKLGVNIDMAKPALKVSVSPSIERERSKLIDALMELTEEDPFLDYEIMDSTGELVLKIFGQVQMEVVEAVLKDRYGIEIEFGQVKTIYKERPKKRSEATIYMGPGPNPYWATIGLSIEPLPIGSGLVYETNISYGYLQRPFQMAVRDGVENACKEGLLGWELTDLKVVFIHGEYSSPVSTPSDFRNLAPYVFWQALNNSETQVLEPYFKYTLQVPNEYCGRAIGDLEKMRASINSIDALVDFTNISGRIPVNTSKSYQADLLSYSNGEGIFITEPCGYDLSKEDPLNDNVRVDKNVEILRYLFQRQDEQYLE